MTIEQQIEALNYEAKQISNRTDNSNFKNAIHWEITINDIKFEYSEGIGHFLNVNHVLYNKLISEPIKKQLLAGERISAWSPAGWNKGEYEKFFTDRVVFPRTKDLMKSYYLEVTTPKIEDVLYSLTMDSDALEYSFSEWCDNFGYDTDSIKANDVYKACQDNAFKLKSLGFNLEKLREHFQDY